MKFFPARRKLAALEATLRQLLNEYRASLHVNADSDIRINVLQAENGALTSDNEDLRGRLEAADRVETDLRARLHESHRHNVILRNAHDGLTRKVTSLEADVAAGIRALESGDDSERALRLANLARPARHAAVAL